MTTVWPPDREGCVTDVSVELTVDRVGLAVAEQVVSGPVDLIVATTDGVAVAVEIVCSEKYLLNPVETGSATRSERVYGASNALYFLSKSPQATWGSRCEISGGQLLPQFFFCPQLSGWWHNQVLFGRFLVPSQYTRPTHFEFSTLFVRIVSHDENSLSFISFKTLANLRLLRSHFLGQLASRYVSSVHPYW